MKTQADNAMPISLADLRARLTGRVITPDDAGYEEARAIFYGGFDDRPGLIVRAADAADVARVVALARETGLELAVRGGGHSLAGHSISDGGIVLDLGEMRGLEIDRANRTAWAAAGLTAAAYTAATAAYGLATGFGDTGSVGIGGITLGGGVGYLVRKHGLTIDSLLAADMVTADGQLLRVDAAQHPDLFWAIRGGGGNFGVVPFFDGGSLTNEALPDLKSWRFAAGIGARYYSSFGPIRVDVGVPLNRQKGDGIVAVTVSLGQAF